MKPVDQTILHDPINGRYGDCMRAMVASILEMEPSEIPHFMHDGTQDAAEFDRRVNDFLRPFNLGYLRINQCKDYLSSTGVRGLHHEASGQTVRGTYHACAAIDGDVVHDPNPSRAGLIKIDEYGIFIVLDPSKPIVRKA